MSPAELREATAEHQRGYQFFGKMLTWSIVAVIVVLVGLLVFVA